MKKTVNNTTAPNPVNKPHTCPTCGGLRLCPGIDGYGGKTTFPCPSCMGRGILWQ